jgi:hypothetical protein
MDTWSWRTVTAAGLSLAAMAFWRLGEAGRAVPPPRAPVHVMKILLAPGTPSAEARREAMSAWWSAQNAVNREREAGEDWDPAVQSQTDQETWRRRLMAGSRSRDLQRAAAAAARAVALARTPRERFAASQLAWRIAADRDDPQVELAAARLLVRLDRRSPVSLRALRHAALASGRRRLARQADAALRALREDSARGLGVRGSAVSTAQ